MPPRLKELSNPFSTGGGGSHFEAHVQASFVTLMMLGGFAPALPCWPIKKVKLQGKFAGYETDDLIVVVEEPGSTKVRKLLGQIKHSVAFTENNSKFGEVIQAAWADFTNASVFARGTDRIALITGPLSAGDVADVRVLLERARCSENQGEYFLGINQAKFSSNGQRRKLAAFRAHLRQANQDIELEDEVVFEFLRHFHVLGYDLDVKSGVTLALLHSMIGLNSQRGIQELWAMVVDEVQGANKNAGTLTMETVSEALRKAFRREAFQEIPSQFIQPPPSSPSEGSTKLALAQELLVPNLLGAWDESVAADRSALEELAGEEYSRWLWKARGALVAQDSPVASFNGIWRIRDRLEVWQNLGPSVLGDDLQGVKRVAIEVLAEADPKFDLQAEERYAASLHGKARKYSGSLRKGLAETVALLGGHSEALTKCKLGLAEITARLVVRELLSGGDWKRWASLGELLPLLAEGSPQEFLRVLEAALEASPSPIDQLFAEETGGLIGSSYLSGLLWSLETLAWDADLLARAVRCLGELANRDPGGRWANRPGNSLTMILLPWRPQTLGSSAIRFGAVETLLDELPEVGWKLVLSLLPGSNATSTGTQKPVWRGSIPPDWSEGTTRGEYWKQAERYSALAVAAAVANRERVAQLLHIVERLPPTARERLLDYVGSAEMLALKESDRLPIWRALVDLVSKHRKFADAAWAMNREDVERLADLAQRIAPVTPSLKYQRLFGSNELNLYEHRGGYEQQREEIEVRRQEAIKEVEASGGISAVVDFAKSVQAPWRVGFAFGTVATDVADRALLPGLLDPVEQPLEQFASGFVSGRMRVASWVWADGMETSTWSFEQIGQFLSLLPFGAETWERASRLLGEQEFRYWSKTPANPYESDGDLSYAISKLLHHGRPNAALQCMIRALYSKMPVDSQQALQALSDAVRSPHDRDSMESHETLELIRYLQVSANLRPEELAEIEWSYLPLLELGSGVHPKNLWRRLAAEPRFFCELIRRVFRSKNEERPTEEGSEESQRIAVNAYQLLSGWRTPPGSRDDGPFDASSLAAWVQAVKAECLSSGHWEVAQVMLGHSLVYAPPDPDGFWIHRDAAKLLDAKDSEEVRSGFRTQMFNSRGVFGDTAGREERELAEGYRTRADAADVAGFHRLAATLRELSASYERDAAREAARESRSAGL